MKTKLAIIAKSLLWGCFTLLLFNPLSAHVDSWYNSLMGDGIVQGGSFAVQEGFYGYPGGLFVTTGSEGFVRLRYDYESAEVFSVNDYLEVDVQVSWKGGNVLSVQTEPFTLRINPSTGECSRPKNLDSSLSLSKAV